VVIRVPAIAYWKTKLTPKLSKELLMSMDLLPTILSITETETDEIFKSDGIDFSETLFSEPILKKAGILEISKSEGCPI